MDNGRRRFCYMMSTYKIKLDARWQHQFQARCFARLAQLAQHSEPRQCHQSVRLRAAQTRLLDDFERPLLMGSLLLCRDRLLGGRGGLVGGAIVADESCVASCCAPTGVLGTSNAADAVEVR